jgi:RimJ/RimL family protein N-acetyltransferase
LRPDGTGSAEIGYLLAPDCRGRGYATTAVRTVLRHALHPDGMGLRRVVWRAVPGNWASRRVAERSGIRVEGTIRGEMLQRGEARDAWLGTIVAGDPIPPDPIPPEPAR